MSASASATCGCRICGNGDLECIKKSNIPVPLESRSFAITDKNYGVTAAIFRCAACGFLQCANLNEVLPFYEALEDAGYEDGRESRMLQAAELIALAIARRPAGRLLDIGAGTGILVEHALKMGYDAVGVEPSRWLCEQARHRGLPVHLGTFPSTELGGPFEVITLIDVIEHVPDPIGLLRDMRAHMGDGSIGIIVTPDVKSLAARLLGQRWWHYRIAHIGYFDRSTLTRAIRSAGFEAVFWSRPGWYFPVEYLLERIKTYLPVSLPIPAWIRKKVVRLNLRDSLTVVVKPCSGSEG
jgi:SAM-dependent methyltransferase